MSGATVEGGVQEALAELQRFFSDQMPPLMVVDSVDLLVRQPPELTASAIHDWLVMQCRVHGSGALVSDYLFHALKKIYTMCEVKLMSPERIGPFVQAVGVQLVNVCPEEERTDLLERISRLGRIETISAAPVDLLHQGGQRSGARPGAAQPGEAIAEEVGRSLRRFSLLLERWEHSSRKAGEVADAADRRGEALTNLIASAALGARSGAELEQHLHRLSGLGVGAQTEELFRTLSQKLPGWVVPIAGGADAATDPLVSGHTAEAMHRIISMAADPEEGAQRFRAMVQAAIEQFNQGALAQSVTMFELAARIIDEKKLDPATVSAVRERAHESLSADRLRETAEDPSKHALLRKALNFFPALTTRRLLEDLMREQRRDRRKLLLALLEVHGPGVRGAAVELLGTCLGGSLNDPQGFIRRNLAFLLRRIRRPADAPVSPEADHLIDLVRPGTPLIVVKEAIGALAQINDQRAEVALIERFHELEESLLGKREDEYGAEETQGLLDRIGGGLARLGTARGLKTVIEHALSRQARWGNTLARLEGLAGKDLSAETELVGQLLEQLRAALPGRMLGFIRHKSRSEDIIRLIQAVSGTPIGAVRQVLEETIDRFPEEEFSRAATRALSSFSPAARPAAAPARAMSGDLELFGLPNLLQSLAESQVTGVLALSDRSGAAIGVLNFTAGKLCGCAAGGLRGETALYQLFEKPAPGTFVFTSQPAGADKDDGSAGPPVDVLSLILEAVRRHDEFEQARAVAPDEGVFKVAGPRPTRPEGEDDAAFLRAVWTKVVAGATPQRCEETMPVDSYRVRRLIAHWIEEGALQPA